MVVEDLNEAILEPEKQEGSAALADVIDDLDDLITDVDDG